MPVAAALLGMLLAAEGVAAPAAPPLAAPAVAPLVPLPPVELRWDAPGGCPDADVVRASIARGVPETPAGFARVQANIVVTALDAEHWRAALELRGADWTATRTLKGPTCDAVADAAGLVIVLALTTELGERPVVVAPPPPPVQPLSTPTPTPTPTLGLAAAGDAGTLPGATAGGTLSLGWRGAHLRVDLRGSLLASQSGTIAGRPDTGATLSLASLGLRGCWLWGGTLSLGPCVGAGLDRLRGAGFGPITPGEGTNFAPLLAPGLQGEGRLARHVAAFVAVDAAIPLVRAQFSVKDIGLVHEAAVVSLRVAAGLELRFR
jgi:hypothetical protein